MKQDDFFVGVYDPTDVRRNLLEASKEIIKSLQSYEALRHIRMEKLSLFREMRQRMEELDMVFARLQKKLPESHLRKSIPEQKKQVVHVKKKFSTELNKLEDQLKEVEKELRTLK